MFEFCWLGRNGILILIILEGGGGIDDALEAGSCPVKLLQCLHSGTNPAYLWASAFWRQEFPSVSYYHCSSEH